MQFSIQKYHVFSAFFLISAWAFWFVTSLSVGASPFGFEGAAPGGRWLAPSVLGSITFLLWGLFIVTARNMWVCAFGILAAFLGSVFFIPPMLGVPLIIFSAPLAVFGAYRVRDDMNSRLTIRLARSFRYGYALIVIAFALLVTGIYFAHTYRAQTLDPVPQFEFSKRTNELLARVLSVISPELSILEDEDMTIDTFLSNAYKKQVMRNFMIPEGLDVSNSNVPFASILSSVLFLTIVSIAMLLRYIFLPLLAFVFWLCLRAGYIAVRKETREVEMVDWQ